jgi:hypothetical protein
VEAGSGASASDWSSTGLVIETNTSTTLKVRDNVPVGSVPQRCLRLRVTGNLGQ